MIQINKNILKKLMAIADANDDDALYDFLRDVNALKDEILEEEEK